jgi:hypothetical protein
MSQESPAEGAPRQHWLKRMGVVGFWFFFIKGLLWLLIPLLILAWGQLGFFAEEG